MRIISVIPLLTFFLNAAPVAPKVLTFPLVTHSEVVHRRRRRLRHLSENPERVAASVYQGYGTHYIDLWVGSPTPQRQTVIVDTGSGITAFPCKGCADCGADHHVGDYFDHEKSESFKKLTCNDCFLGNCGSDHCSMSMRYVEGSSWTAFEAKDRMYTGGNHEEPVANMTGFELNFGCQTSLTGLFKTQLENGIAGMMNDDKSLWKQLYDAGEIDKKIFSLCYVNNQEVDKKGTPAGLMSLGGSDESIWKTPMVYASSYHGGDGFYGIGAKALYLWDANDSNPRVGNMTEMVDKITKIGTFVFLENDNFSSQQVLDSGTTSTYFPTTMKYLFMKHWKEIVGTEFNSKGFQMTEEQIKKVPTILIQFDGKGNEHLDPDETPGLAGKLDPDNKHDIIIAITPTQYILYKGKEKGFVGRVHFSSNDIFGANTMAGHDVAFDVENGRIGFAQSDCSKDTVDR